MILQLRSRYSYFIFNSLFYEEPNLGDDMAEEKQSHSLIKMNGIELGLISEESWAY